MKAALKENTNRLIKIARKKKNLSQKELGDKIGVSDAYIRKLEHGAQSDAIFTICNTLEINILSIIDFEFRNHLSKSLIEAAILLEKNEES
jgi:transcriptional regulator with XRE-family HTH domain